MTPARRYLLTVAGLFALVCACVGAVVGFVWAGLDDAGRAALLRIATESINTLIFGTILLLLACAWAVRLFFRAYVFPAAAASEDAGLALAANPDHRLHPAGAPEIQRLARDINTFATRYQALQSEVEARIGQAKAEVEAERNRLAALMADLAQSVMMCNAEGRILLYNHSARQLFAHPANGVPTNGASLVGLGRSVFAVIDRSLIVHALDHIHHRLSQGDANPVARFVTTAPGDQMIRGHLAPVRAGPGEVSGFVLTLEDVTGLAERSGRRDVLLRSLTEGTRAALASIRTAIEAIIDYPDMDRDRRSRLTEIIHEETLGLGARLNHALADLAEDVSSNWLLDDMLGGDLLAAIRREFAGRLGVETHVTAADESIWLKVDSYTIVQALGHVVGRLRDERGVREVGLALRGAGRFAQLDVTWEGPPLRAETFGTWEREPLVAEGANGVLTLRAAAERHGGEFWYSADPASGVAYLRLLLPMAEPRPVWDQPPALGSRPEYYDFDLFHQAGQKPELDQRPLTELTYTVFDTETTGLEPSDGDEIISIGAVRIVNGRLLRHEVFEQLIDPRRPIAEAAFQVHGISRQLLRGQPTIEQALPLFFAFAEDTVLVAHNAAFDLRFLQLKEAQTGVAFTQPVLDTLLLAPVAQPLQPDYSLEAIARRLGVSVVGRHTALGDAMVTGEVFLRLIPLLAARGIRTLGEARAAAQKTFYARVQY